jgi:hypothetical protein
MRIQLLCLVLLLGALAMNAGGCLAVAVGAGAAGTVAYLAGDLETEEPYNIEQTYAAAREAVEELGLNVIEGETGKDALSARVVARDSADKKVEIRLNAVTRQTTKLSVRVGTFGNDAKAHLIYNTIRENLKAAATVVANSNEATPGPPEPPAD